MEVESADHAMTVLEFIASMTGSLSWPLAAIVIAALFRSQIAHLLERISELGWGDAKATFTKKIDRAEATAQTLPVAENQTQLPAHDFDEGDRFSRLLTISPSAAVLDAWQSVEAQLKRLAAQFNLLSSSFPNPVNWVKEMSKQGHLPSKVVTLIQELRSIRNVAAHSDDVSVSDAIRFRDLAYQVSFALALLEDGNEGS